MFHKSQYLWNNFYIIFLSYVWVMTDSHLHLCTTTVFKTFWISLVAVTFSSVASEMVIKKKKVLWVKLMPFQNYPQQLFVHYVTSFYFIFFHNDGYINWNNFMAKNLSQYFLQGNHFSSICIVSFQAVNHCQLFNKCIIQVKSKQIYLDHSVLKTEYLDSPKEPRF